MRFSRLLPLLPLLLLAACGKTPDHVRYIPDNAAAVVGVNTKELGKKIAWNKITGSDLLDELQDEMKKSGGSSMEDLKASGIDPANTFYVYFTYTAGADARVTALIPLDDAGKWASYVKKTFPAAAVKKVGDRSEAALSDKAYAGWTDDLLIVTTADRKEVDYNSTDWMTEMPDSVLSGDMMPPPPPEPGIDLVKTAANLAAAFSVTKDASLAKNDRFTSLERGGHDVTLYINYDAMTSALMGSSGMAGMGMAAQMWAGAALTGGFDFEDGRVAGEMKYFAPEAIQDAYKQMSNKDIDESLLDRVPTQNLDALVAWHLSPKGLRAVLEKMGMLGMLNMGLAGQGITPDDLFDAFAGDMVLAVNDFKVESKTETYGEGAYAGSYTSSEPAANYLFAIKIGKKEKFDKIMGVATTRGMLKSNGAGLYTLGDATPDAPVLVVDKGLAVAARTAAAARAYIDKKAGGTMPEPVRKHVYGQPIGMYVNLQRMLGAFPTTSDGSASDSVALDAARRLFAHATLNGGTYKGGAFSYTMSLDLQNKSENSLVQLLDFASRIKKAEDLNRARNADIVDVPMVPAPGMMPSDTAALVEPMAPDAR